MLPFLNKRRMAASMMMTKKPGEAPEPIDESNEYDSDSLLYAAEDLLKAVADGNPKAVAAALKAAFEICDSQPQEEAPMEGEE